jgi:hypothetical protein
MPNVFSKIGDMPIPKNMIETKPIPKEPND